MWRRLSKPQVGFSLSEIWFLFNSLGVRRFDYLTRVFRIFPQTSDYNRDSE
jgi:hypothetical protein